MGIISSIIRSKDDLVKPKSKSYWNYRMGIELVSKPKLTNKRLLLPSDKKAMKHELSDAEPIEEAILLRNTNKKLGRFTTSQIKEILDDMGFNVDVMVSEDHFSDIDAVMNIGGSSIPGWVYFARIVSKYFPSKEKLLLSKLSAGKDRLHLRIFEENDGSWLIAAHTDHNWLSLNLKQVYESHLASKVEGKTGAGDYITGTLMMFNLLKEFSKHVDENKVFRQKEIDKIVRDSYNMSVIKKIGTGNLTYSF
jgi:hypothetical protein